MTWSATRRNGADLTVILESPVRSGPAIRLVLDRPELRLENSFGEPLACASDLPSLLDAVEGGVAAARWWC